MPSGTKRGVVRSSGFVQRPVFHAYVVLLQIISRLVPRPEEFAEWLRRNLCIPDQEYVDSLISLYLCYNSVYILGDLLDGLLLIPSQGYGKVAPIQLESKSSVHTPAIR